MGKPKGPKKNAYLSKEAMTVTLPPPAYVFGKELRITLGGEDITHLIDPVSVQMNCEYGGTKLSLGLDLTHVFGGGKKGHTPLYSIKDEPKAKGLPPSPYTTPTWVDEPMPDSLWSIVPDGGWSGWVSSLSSPSGVMKSEHIITAEKAAEMAKYASFVKHSNTESMYDFSTATGAGLIDKVAQEMVAKRQAEKAKNIIAKEYPA